MPFFDITGYSLSFEHGFRDRIKSKLDIPATRNLIRTLDDGDYNEYGYRVPPEQWPESLKGLKSESVGFWVYKNNPLLKIMWGGGFFHWGVEIGLEDFEIPESDMEDGSESRLLVEPGIYVFTF